MAHAGMETAAKKLYEYDADRRDPNYVAWENASEKEREPYYRRARELADLFKIG